MYHTATNQPRSMSNQPRSMSNLLLVALIAFPATAVGPAATGRSPTPLLKTARPHFAAAPPLDNYRMNIPLLVEQLNDEPVEHR